MKGVDRAVQQSHKPSPDLDVPLSHQAAIVASTPPSASVPPYPSLYALLDEYRSRSAPILKDCRALADLGLRSRLEPPTVGEPPFLALRQAHRATAAHHRCMCLPKTA